MCVPGGIIYKYLRDMSTHYDPSSGGRGQRGLVLYLLE